MNDYSTHLQDVKKALCGIVDKLDEYPTKRATRTDFIFLIAEVANDLANVIGYDGSIESIKRAL